MDKTITVGFKYGDEICTVIHIFEPTTKLTIILSSIATPVNIEDLGAISRNEYIERTRDIYPKEFKIPGSPINIIATSIVNHFMRPECYPNRLHNSVVEIFHFNEYQYEITLTLDDGKVIDLPTTDHEYDTFRF